MVEDTITDGRRIAQMLASELTGLETGALADVAVVDANPDAAPEKEGGFAYAIEYNDIRVGKAYVHESAARLQLQGAVPERALESLRTDSAIAVSGEDDAIRLRIQTARAVKPIVDAIQTMVTALDEGEL